MREEDDRVLEREIERGMQGLVESVEGFKRKVEEEKVKMGVEGKACVEDKEEDWEDQDDEIEHGRESEEEVCGDDSCDGEEEDEAEVEKENEDEWVLVERAPFGKRKLE